jgi:hypothetical protein
MATRLPRGARLPQGVLAVVDVRKIEDYCLNPSHPRGCQKAPVFREVLGLTREDAVWLRNELLAAAESAGAMPLTSDAWGEQWRVDSQVTRQGRTVVVRSIWIIRAGEFQPRFVSGWILR